MTDGPQWDWDVDADATATSMPAPSARPLSSPAKRLGAALLDVALSVVTCYIGWLVWSIVVWREGKTPAKQLLRMRVIEEYDGRPANGWTMAIRELVAKPLAWIPIVLTLFVLAFMPLWDSKRQALWDRLSGTVVIDEQ